MITPFRHGCDFGFDLTYMPSRDPTFLFEHIGEGHEVSSNLKVRSFNQRSSVALQLFHIRNFHWLDKELCSTLLEPTIINKNPLHDTME